MSADYSIPVLEVNGLSKRYKGARTHAVNNLNFTVAKGEIFGFLGPNGAGKTTTISIMSTLMKPSKGQIKICGIDIEKLLATRALVEAALPGEQMYGFIPDAGLPLGFSYARQAG